MKVGTYPKVTSEIGYLEKVILHKPGKELLHIYPTYLEQMLFNEIPWLHGARKEHEQFIERLRGEGVEVLLLDQLMEEILRDEEIRVSFIKENLKESRITEPFTMEAIYNYLLQLTPSETVDALIRGLNKNFVQNLKKTKSLSDYTQHSFPFYIPPLPSMYFTRDQGVMLDNNILLTSMVYPVRKRESLFIKYLTYYHPLFSNADKGMEFSLPKGLEGGDVLVLSSDTVMVGLSQRTTEEAIEKAARHLLIDKGICKQVLVVQIPFKKQYLHLDMVLNQVDRDKFLLFPGIENKVHCYRLTSGYQDGEGYIRCEKENSLRKLLENAFGFSIQIIYSGGSDDLTSSREQQSGSNNILVVSPGKVVAYNRNEITNEILSRNGVKVLDFEGSELIRGMGGPRCMSMPIQRREP
ncbi:arginine deiminase family protein [Natranaerofaba carboxydovora]|uniref:arginine deiminase n=1 Tax=Natranaerofaba carboxydovora TaxID=2742683 RepID=UPI001F14301F|nr:arginine deiminase family protein [Natranaerofaba carboxydovora]UMZ74479.1 Arginine deiminase [Natranaerofaba carboxydovora]